MLKRALEYQGMVSLLLESPRLVGVHFSARCGCSRPSPHLCIVWSMHVSSLLQLMLQNRVRCTHIHAGDAAKVPHPHAGV